MGGPNHRDVSPAIGNLGNAYCALGDAVKQRVLLERALFILERELGSNHRDVAFTLQNLGVAYGNLGDAAKKQVLLERALLILETEFGPNHRRSVVVREALNELA